MKENSLIIKYIVCNSEKELDSNDQKLLAEAENASADSYSPYSRFRVGAAVRLEKGKIIRGNNQENAAYPLSMCAERIALFQAGANHPKETIEAIAIIADSDQFQFNEVITPCGACRQVMAEYENKQLKNIKVILASGKGEIWIFESIANLLPFMFKADQLKKNNK